VRRLEHWLGGYQVVITIVIAAITIVIERI
jgi:hypothetical protein